MSRRRSRLLVISHTAHYVRDGRTVGWGPTVRELSNLARLFEELVHVAPLHAGPAPESALPYEAQNLRHIPVRPSGGTTLASKLGVLRAWAGYVGLILPELRRCDVVHVRCPANISLVAIMLLSALRNPRVRWIKYAGNWQPRSRESLSYSLQRWLLRRDVARAVVTVNGTWPNQASHVHPFLNPCLTAEELEEGARAGSAKRLSAPLRMLFVGRLEDSKGCVRAVDILEGLVRRGVDARLDLVGDGPERRVLESRIEGFGPGDRVRILGWVSRPRVNELYARAHILLFPSSSSEGWPKVLGEGMAYGVVPVAGSVSCIAQYLESFHVGRAIEPFDREGFVEAIAGYVSEPSRWVAESRRAVEAARRFTYGNYVVAVRDLLGLEAV